MTLRFARQSLPVVGLTLRLSCSQRQMYALANGASGVTEPFLHTGNLSPTWNHQGVSVRWNSGGDQDFQGQASL